MEITYIITTTEKKLYSHFNTAIKVFISQTIHHANFLRLKSYRTYLQFNMLPFAQWTSSYYDKWYNCRVSECLESFNHPPKPGLLVRATDLIFTCVIQHVHTAINTKPLPPGKYSNGKINFKFDQTIKGGHQP